MSIIVAIQTKNKPAPDVTEPLLTTLDGLKMRGQTELYDQLSIKEHGIDIPFQSPVQPGEIVQLTDYEFNQVHAGRCTSSVISVQNEVVKQSITFESAL